MKQKILNAQEMAECAAANGNCNKFWVNNYEEILSEVNKWIEYYCERTKCKKKYEDIIGVKNIKLEVSPTIIANKGLLQLVFMTKYAVGGMEVNLNDIGSIDDIKTICTETLPTIIKRLFDMNIMVYLELSDNVA